MLNKVTLIGRLGSDVELKNFENGGAAASFSLATDESYKNSAGEKVEKTEWHRLVVSGELAKTMAKYLHKGSLIYVEGKIQSREYEDKENVKRSVTEIYVLEFKFLDKKEA